MAFFKKLKKAVANLSTGDLLVIGGTILAGVAAVAAGGAPWVLAIAVVATVVLVVGEMVKSYEKEPVSSPSYA